MLQRAVNGCTALSKSGPGFVLGSYSMKTLGGVLIGLGAVACLGGGAGLPLVIAGAVIFTLATAMSTTALEEKNPKSVAVHLFASVVAGAVGVGLGFLGLVSAAGPVPGTVKFVQAIAGVIGGTFPIAMDKFSLEDRLNRDFDLEEVRSEQALQARVDQAQINLAAREASKVAEIARQNGSPRVDSIVLGDLQKVYRKQGGRITLHKGDETIHLVIDNGQDCISLTKLIPSEEPELDQPDDYNGDRFATYPPHVWVALRQSADDAKPAIYTLHQKSSVCGRDGQLLPGFVRHPTTRVALSAAGSILEDRELLKWLDPGFTDDDQLPAASD